MQLASPATWRSHPHTSRGHLVIWKGNTVFACSVNQSLILNPVSQLTYDTVTAGAYTDLKPGMLVKVSSSGGVFKGYARIVDGATATDIFLGYMSFGDINFEDNDLLVVTDEYRIWSKPPLIAINGRIWKDRTIAFVDDATALPPKINAGGPAVGFIGDDTFLYVDFVLTSYPVAYGATIGANPYGGSVGDGTITAGSIASGTFTAKFPAGKRNCEFTVVDSNGITGTIQVPVAALERTGVNAPTPCVITSYNLEADRAALGFTVEQSDVSLSAVPAGALVIYFEEEVYDATEGSLSGPTGREAVKFVGFINNDNIDANGNITDIDFNASNMSQRLEEIVGFDLTMKNAASPNSWVTMSNLSLFRLAHHILQWHTTALLITDFEQPAWVSIYTKTPPTLELDKGSPLSQLNTLAGYIDGSFGADKNGVLYMRRDPQFMSDADRADVITIVTLQTTDYKEAVWRERNQKQVHWTRGSGIIGDYLKIVPALSLGPGYIPGQGLVEDTLDRQLILDQDDLNVRTGRKYTLNNIDIPELTLTVINTGLVASPSWGEKVIVNLPDTLNRRGKLYSSEEFVLKSVRVSYKNGEAESEEWVLEPLVAGVAGIFQPVPIDKLYDISYTGLPDYNFDIPVMPQLPAVAYGDSPSLFVWTRYAVSRLLQGTTHWENLINLIDIGYDSLAYLESNAYTFRLDPWNPKNCAYWIVTNPGFSNFRFSIYYLTGISGDIANLQVEKIFDSDNFALTTGYDMQAAVGGEFMFDASINVNGLIAFLARDVTDGSPRIVKRAGRGTGWTVESPISADYANVIFAQMAMGHHASGSNSGRMYATARSNSNTKSTIYKSTNNGNTWVADFDYPSTSSNPRFHLIIPYADNPNDNIAYFINFDFVGNDQKNVLRRNEDGSYTYITPFDVVGGDYYSIHQIGIYTNDRQKVVLLGFTVAGDRVFLLSDDGGDTFTEVADGLTGNSFMSQLWTWPQDFNRLFMVEDNGVFITDALTTSDPVTWTDITYDLAPQGGLTGIYVSGAVASWVK